MPKINILNTSNITNRNFANKLTQITELDATVTNLSNNVVDLNNNVVDLSNNVADLSNNVFVGLNNNIVNDLSLVIAKFNNFLYAISDLNGSSGSSDIGNALAGPFPLINIQSDLSLSLVYS
tara:strand:- start:32 stop:397 length:366 start_codon:yes stop_codon:yes gene_type:complete